MSEYTCLNEGVKKVCVWICSCVGGDKLRVLAECSECAGDSICLCGGREGEGGEKGGVQETAKKRGHVRVVGGVGEERKVTEHLRGRRRRRDISFCRIRREEKMRHDLICRFGTVFVLGGDIQVTYDISGRSSSDVVIRCTLV